MAKEKKQNTEKKIKQEFAQSIVKKHGAALRAQMKIKTQEANLKKISNIHDPNYNGEDEEFKKKDYKINSKTGKLMFKKTFKKNLKKGQRNEKHNQQLTVIREEPEKEFDTLSNITENNEIKDIVDPKIIKQAVAARKKEILKDFMDQKVSEANFVSGSGHLQNGNNIQELVDQLEGVYHEEINVFANPQVQADLMDQLMDENYQDEAFKGEAIKEYENSAQFQVSQKVIKKKKKAAKKAQREESSDEDDAPAV